MREWLIFLVFLMGTFAMDYRPIQLYSGFTVIAPNTYDAYHVDLSCTSQETGNLVLNIDNPDWQDQSTGVYAYCSVGPAKGRLAPWPDPTDPSTFTYTTENGTGNPLPGFTVPNAGGIEMFCTIDSPDGLLGEYTLVVEFTSSTKGYRNLSPKYRPMRTKLPTNSAIVQKPLYYSNKLELAVGINWNNYSQFELPLCASALIAAFGQNTQVCFHVTVLGQSPQDIAVQFISLYSTPGQKTPKWETRDPNDNPFEDYSGRSKLFINKWISLPVLVKDLPPTLYHTVYAEGGAGDQPPFTNFFTISYDINTYCPS